MSLTLTHDSIVTVTEDQITSGLPDEAILLNVKSDVYYGLLAVGARIWDLLQQPITVQKICDTILAEYDVAPERCEVDLLQFLEQLIAEGLVEVSNETSA